MAAADNNLSKQGALVVGAGSGIGEALLRRWSENSGWQPLGVSRTSAANASGSTRHIACDYTDASLDSLAQQLLSEQLDLARVVICNGVLQGDHYAPERALSQLNEEAMASVFAINTFLPMRILGALMPLLKRSTAPKVAVLSARVGSIGDNRLGGWYSYRGSKAALNIMLRSAAFELRRVNRQAKLMAYHPGTVDTPLSRPFQKGVDPKVLLTPEKAAEYLDKVLNNAEADGDLSYLDWRGDTIPW